MSAHPSRESSNPKPVDIVLAGDCQSRTDSKYRESFEIIIVILFVPNEARGLRVVPAFRMISNATSRELAPRTLPSASRGSTFLVAAHQHHLTYTNACQYFPLSFHCVT